MKKSIKIQMSFTLLVIITIFLLWNTNLNQLFESEYNISQIKNSSSLNLTITPILINNTDPLKNWEKIASENEWCSGSGTWGNPFCIENVTINALGTGPCIKISNSNVSFEIRNCVLYNGSSGIHLENASNGILFNNTCFNNNRGILCYDVFGNCNNISVENNKLYGNYAGLSLYSNILTSIINNIIFENTEFGIELITSKNTIIEENDISKSYGTKGVIYEVTCENSTYIGNIIQDNLGGILIQGSSNIIIYRNLFLKNTIWGLNATFCQSNNLAYLNCFVSNGNNAKDMGLSFEWDNGSIGNYWSDYTGKDSDGDNIGDTPYNIQGLPDVPDNYPLMTCPFYTPEDKIIHGYKVFSLLTVIFIISLIIIQKKRNPT